MPRVKRGTIALKKRRTLMKAVKANKGAKKEYCELAEEIMDFEERNIERLKSYLNG